MYTKKGSWLWFGGLLLIGSTSLNPSIIITSGKNAQQISELHGEGVAPCSLRRPQKGLSLLRDKAQEAAPCSASASEGKGMEL